MNKTTWSTRFAKSLFWLMIAAFTVFFFYTALSGTLSGHTVHQCHNDIVPDVLRSEFPMMVFSALSIILGLVVVTVSLCFRYIAKSSDNNMISLGLVSVFLGLWKITDLASLPLVFPDAALAIRCMSVGTLLLGGLCLMLYCSALIRKGSCSVREMGLLLLLLLPAGILIYTLIVFTSCIRTATRRAYTDVCTRLVNRIRWDEMMYGDTAIAEPYCFLMIDLNGLKHVNDTLGHQAGDQMIFRLADLLRSTLPCSAMICRWGGDEFAVLLHSMTRPTLDHHIEELFAATDRYNADHPELPIHFSLGAALSSEHPGISKTELFRLADEQMYRSKQMWYAAR